MIYKNFYNKYKMSEQINLKEQKEIINKDIEDIPNVLEEGEIVSINSQVGDKKKEASELEEGELEEGELEEGELKKEEIKEELIIPEEEIPEKKQNEILLKLGDIIIISDPTNEILNNNVFLIEYIDPTKIKLINSETFEKTILQISPDGVIGDGNIISIKIISSNSEKGYARQNDLLPGTWINIYFGGEIPTVITGEITNIEEDMIEIRTTDGDTLFINFNYQGIPEDLPIETFEIRPAIKVPEEKKELNVDELVELGDEEMMNEVYPEKYYEEKTRVQNESKFITEEFL